MHLYHVLIKYWFTTIDNLDTPLWMEKYLK
jgi:hypothetical protein